jgi:hypothetical protein
LTIKYNYNAIYFIIQKKKFCATFFVENSVENLLKTFSTLHRFAILATQVRQFGETGLPIWQRYTYYIYRRHTEGSSEGCKEVTKKTNFTHPKTTQKNFVQL